MPPFVVGAMEFSAALLVPLALGLLWALRLPRTAGGTGIAVALGTSALLLPEELLIASFVAFHPVNLLLYLRTAGMAGLSTALVWRHRWLGVGSLVFASIGLGVLPSLALEGGVPLLLLAEVGWAGTLGAWLVGLGLDVAKVDAVAPESRAPQRQARVR